MGTSTLSVANNKPPKKADNEDFSVLRFALVRFLIFCGGTAQGEGETRFYLRISNTTAMRTAMPFARAHSSLQRQVRRILRHRSSRKVVHLWRHPASGPLHPHHHHCSPGS